jgi:hypothetical protein
MNKDQLSALLWQIYEAGAVTDVDAAYKRMQEILDAFPTSDSSSSVKGEE